MTMHETIQESRGHKLKWQEGRWHCAGDGIHAGNGLELLGADGQWFRVRIESADCGRRLFAYVNLHGHEFTRPIYPDSDRLRWPR